MYNNGKYTIDYKTTVWERVNFNTKEDFLDAIRVIEANDGYIEKIFEMPYDLGFEDMSETAYYMTPEENDLRPTIEAYDNGILVYDNVNKNMPNG